MNRVKSETLTYDLRQKLSDFLILIKFRLTFFVVLSSVLAYLISAGSQAKLSAVLLLALGGYLVAGAANALNQILEREFDRNMTRTANRPLAAQRMNVSGALVIAGFMCLFGIIALGLFNPLCAFLGMLSLILYSFIYTPLKRFNTLSVAVGAIPGALPVLIGSVAFEGEITALALVLFMIQFLWQFPHFWAIGWLSFDQYKKAGFKLLPMQNGKIDPALGFHSFVYSLILLAVVIGAFILGYLSLTSFIGVGIFTILYAYFAFQFNRNFDQKSAKALMFSSFAYLPLSLIIICLAPV